MTALSALSALTAFTHCSDALAAGDMPALAAILDPAVVWHQPGTHSLAGDHVGPDQVLQLLGGFMQRSNGTFALQPTGRPIGQRRPGGAAPSPSRPGPRARQAWT